MAINPLIKKFSINIFNYLYYESEAIPRPDGYRLDPEYKLNTVLVYAVMCRQEILRCFHDKDFKESYQIWSRSEQKFYYYLCKKFLDFRDYLDPNIFDKILIVCSFVMEMGISSYYRKNDIYLKFPLSFAKYFDSYLKEDFFNNGGLSVLVNYSEKYRSASAYICDLLKSNRTSLNQELFISSLITRIKKDYHFDNLLILLNKHISKFQNEISICRKCKSFKGLTTELILKSCKDDLTSVESFLQICMKLMKPSDLEEFNKKLVYDLKHRNCKEAEDATEGEFLEPCLKCIVLINTKQDTHSDRIEINFKNPKLNFLREDATKEVIKLMFDQKPDLQSESGSKRCLCCHEKLNSQGSEDQLNIAEKPAPKQEEAAEGSNPVEDGEEGDQVASSRNLNVLNVLQDLTLEKESTLPSCRKRKH